MRKYAFILFIIVPVITCVVSIYMLLVTQWGSKLLLDIFINTNYHSFQIKFDEIKGSIINGLYFKNLTLILSPYKNFSHRALKSCKIIKVKFNDLFVKINLFGILQNELNIEQVASSKLEAFGDFHLPFYFYNLPSPIELNMNLPFKLIIQNISIDVIILHFDKSEFYKIYIKKLNLLNKGNVKSNRNRKDKNKNFDKINYSNIGSLVITYKDKEIIKADILGYYNCYTSEIDANLVGKILGCPVILEVFVSISNNSLTPISANIVKCEIDLIRLYRWLSALWIDSIPIAFDGNLKIFGSFLYNKKVGFTGNINGKIENLRLLTTLFLWNFAKINVDYKIFDRKIYLKLFDSKLGGEDILGSGTIDINQDGKLYWDFYLYVINLELDKFLNTMPWILRKSLLNLGGDIWGSCSFYISVQGINPNITAGLEIKNGNYRNKNVNNNFYLNYTYENNFLEPSKLKFNWKLQPVSEKIMRLFEQLYNLELKHESINELAALCEAVSTITRENDRYIFQTSGNFYIASYSINFISTNTNTVINTSPVASTKYSYNLELQDINISNIIVPIKLLEN